MLARTPFSRKPSDATEACSSCANKAGAAVAALRGNVLRPVSADRNLDGRRRFVGTRLPWRLRPATPRPAGARRWHARRHAHGVFAFRVGAGVAVATRLRLLVRRVRSRSAHVARPRVRDARGAPLICRVAATTSLSFFARLRAGEPPFFAWPKKGGPKKGHPANTS